MDLEIVSQNVKTVEEFNPFFQFQMNVFKVWYHINDDLIKFHFMRYAAITIAFCYINLMVVTNLRTNDLKLGDIMLRVIKALIQASTKASSSWSCWSTWSSCSLSCGGSGGTRSRTRACVPGTGGDASSLSCIGDSIESDNCGSAAACPDLQCPPDFQYSVG